MAEKKLTAAEKQNLAEKPRVSRKAIKPRVPEIDIVNVGKSEVTGFIDFIREQGVVGLAVGLAIGTAVGATVKTIVSGFINPIVGFIIGGIDLDKLEWVVIKPNSHGYHGLIFSYGTILSSVITLLATAIVLYAAVHIAKLDRLDKKKS